MSKKKIIYSVLVVFFIIGFLKWLGVPSSEPLFSLFGKPTLFKIIIIVFVFLLIIFIFFKTSSKKT